MYVTSVLLTHGEKSVGRMEKHLEGYGISCVSVELTGRTYTVDSLGDLSNVDVGLVYPGRLIEGGLVDSFVDVSWVNDCSDVLLCRNKARVTAELEKGGIPVPESLFVSSPVDRGEVLSGVREMFESSVVVKPNSATRGRGVVKADDLDSFSGVMDYFDVIHESSLVFDNVYVVQEFIEDAVDYRVMVFGGEYVGAVVRERDGWKKNVHRGGCARGVTPPERVIEVAEEAARELEVDFCGVDVLVSGARCVVNEVNAKPTVDNFDKYESEFYDRLASVIEDADQD